MAKVNAPEGYMSIPDAAKLVGIHKNSMYQHVFDYHHIPVLTQTAGARSFHWLKREDVEAFKNDRDVAAGKRVKNRYKVYEIVCISLGQLDVLFKTESLRELSKMYIRMMERENKLVRVRADGHLLTIHESDRLGNAYHPRTKSRYAI